MKSYFAYVGFVIAFAVFGSGLFVRAGAQSSTSSTSDEISLYLGEYLPSGITGVTEILPVFGGRYGIGLNRLGLLEIGGFNSHAYGTDFTTGELSLRGSLPFGVGLDVLYYGGLDFNYYKPENQEERIKEMGYHIGAGAMMSITDSLWLRSDLKFMGGPGTSLYLLFGVVFRGAGGGTAN